MRTCKTCKTCNSSLPETAFYASPTMRDKLMKDCKDCYKAARRQKNLDRYHNKYGEQRAYKVGDEEFNLKLSKRTMLESCRYRAQKRGLEFDLKVSDIEIPAFCPVMGIPLMPSPATPTDNSPSLDRIDNTRGYVKDNVAVISFLANRLKSSLTLPQLHALVAYVERTSTP